MTALPHHDPPVRFLTNPAAHFLLLALLLISAAATAQHGSPIALSNPGFELPELGSTPETSYFAGATGWATGTGVGTTWQLATLAPSPAPEGDQYLYADVGSFDLTQQVGTFEDGYRYVFTISVFPLRTDSSNTAEVAFDIYETSFGNFARTEYEVHDPPWFAGLIDYALVPQQWNELSVTIDSRDYPNHFGKPMRIRLTGYRLAVDNARLVRYTVDEHPEEDPKSFHVSSSSGNDANDGLSPATPWASFRNINARILQPGQKVLLKRGDAWTEELHLRGKGSPGFPIELASFGDPSAPRPRISRVDLANDKCVVIQRASYWRIRELDCRNAKLGLYLRYHNSWDNRDVQVSDCHFEGNTNPTLDPADHLHEFAFSNAIWLGGHVWNSNRSDGTVLDGLSVTNCTFKECAHGFGNGWYYPLPYKGRLRNVYIADCTAVDCFNGAVALFDVDGGLVERVVSLGGGYNAWTGSALGFTQGSRNVVIDNCSYSFVDRLESGDGVGYDFEGDSENCIFSNNVIHGNSSAGLLVLSTNGPNTNIRVENSTFYDNCLNPWNSEINTGIVSGSSQNSVLVQNTGIYNRPSTPTYFNGETATITQVGNRLGTYDRTREKRWWDFETEGDLEGWNGFNDWVSPTVEGGALTGASTTGNDPFVQSPPTWVNVHLQPYIWLRMSHTAGEVAQFFYITDADPAWNAQKSTAFEVVPDGVMRDYFIDLRAAGAKGVITQIRIDPAWTAGSSLAIDHIRITGSLDPGQAAPIYTPPPPTEMTFTSIGSEDGTVLESAAGSGIGGSTTSGTTTVTMGDDAQNRRFRPVLSFDTSAIPDDVTLVSAQLGFTRIGVTGNEPWTYGGHLIDAHFCHADIASPQFGNSPAIEPADFNAPSTADQAARFIVAFKNGLTVLDLMNSQGLGQVNKAGRTQVRLYTDPGTDGDNGRDSITIASGGYSTASQRPFLKVAYYSGAVPPSPPRPTLPDPWVPPLQIPKPPSGLAASVLSPDSIQWTWQDKSADESAIDVYLAAGTVLPAGASLSLPPDSASHTATVLVPNTVYTLGVRFRNEAGSSGLLDQSTARTHARTPGAPSLIETGATHVRLLPDLLDNPAGTEYALWCETTAQWVGDDGSLGATAFWTASAGPRTILGLASDTAHSFRIKARNADGLETILGDALLARTLVAPPPDAWLVR